MVPIQDILHRIAWDPVFGADGVARMIPYHRVREVLRDGKIIWRRRVDDEDADEGSTPGT